MSSPGGDPVAAVMEQLEASKIVAAVPGSVLYQLASQIVAAVLANSAPPAVSVPAMQGQVVAPPQGRVVASVLEPPAVSAPAAVPEQRCGEPEAHGRHVWFPGSGAGVLCPGKSVADCVDELLDDAPVRGAEPVVPDTRVVRVGPGRRWDLPEGFPGDNPELLDLSDVSPSCVDGMVVSFSDARPGVWFSIKLPPSKRTYSTSSDEQRAYEHRSNFSAKLKRQATKRLREGGPFDSLLVDGSLWARKLAPGQERFTARNVGAQPGFDVSASSKGSAPVAVPPGPVEEVAPTAQRKLPEIWCGLEDIHVSHDYPIDGNDYWCAGELAATKSLPGDDGMLWDQRRGVWLPEKAFELRWCTREKSHAPHTWVWGEGGKVWGCAGYGSNASVCEALWAELTDASAVVDSEVSGEVWDGGVDQYLASYLKDRPLTWVTLAPSSPASRAWHIQKITGSGGAFRPYGSFEARQAGNGSIAARFVGKSGS